MKCKNCKTKVKDVTYCPYCGEYLGKNKFTDITIILDRSGSMASVVPTVIKGYNDFLLEQKQLEGEALISLFKFNENLNKVYENIPLRKVDNISKEDYNPEGTTALLDAVGACINKKTTFYEELKSSKVPEKTLFVIITDGYENSSKEFTKTQIKSLIDSKKKQGWDFAFIGAGIDAFTESEKYGVGRGQTMSIQHNNEGYVAAFNSLTSETIKYRDSGGKFLFSQTADE